MCYYMVILTVTAPREDQGRSGSTTSVKTAPTWTFHYTRLLDSLRTGRHGRNTVQHMDCQRAVSSPSSDWIEQGLTSPPTQYRLSGRQSYRSKDPTNSIKVLKEKLASHRPEEAQNPPGASHRVTSEPLKKRRKKPITVRRAQRDKAPHSIVPTAISHKSSQGYFANFRRRLT